MRLVALLGLLALATPGVARAQHDAPHFRRIGTEDGLSQGTALAIAQDGRGFLWVGTQVGLHRYDGRDLVVYRADPADSTSLSDDYVSALLVDGSDRLWVGTVEGGLARYDAEGDRFVRQRLEHPRAPSSGGAPLGVHALAEAEGLLWVSSSHGLAAVDAGSGAVAWPSLEEPIEEPCRVLTPAPGGGLLLGCSDGSVHRLAYDRTRARITLEARVDFGARVTVLEPVGDSIVVGTWGGGAYVVDTRVARPRSLPLPEAAGGSGAVVMAAREDHLGDLWIGTRAGLSQLTPEGARRHHTAHAFDPTSLSHSEITSIYEDRSGVLWVGTFDGLNALSPYRKAVVRYTGMGDGRGLLPTPGVVAIGAAADGALWLGTMSGDVTHVDLERGWVRNYRPDGTPEGSTGADIMSLSVDAGGDPWVTVWGRGIARISAASDSVTRIFDEEGLGGLRDGVAIHVDHSGTVWVGSATAGLLTVEPTDGSARPFVDARGSTPFASAYVWPIREPVPGVLWVGTSGTRGGVHRLTKGGDVESWTFDPASDRASDRSLAGGRVLTTLVASDGVVWIGTYEGLSRLDPESGSVRVYRASDGLPNEIVEGILEDDDGRIWISTDGGLARLDPASGQIRAFHEAAGLQAEKFYANSAFKDRAGRLYFGGPRGLTVIRPDLLPERSPSGPPVALTSFSVFGEERLARSTANVAVPIELGPDENFFAFRFAALDFVDPAHNRYRYMLEELDSDWVEAGVEGTAAYTSVPPGEYTFRVSAANSEGVWNEDALRVAIAVDPPYHQTVWFRSGVVLLLALVLFAAYRNRMAQIQRVAAVRQRIAGELHDDIGANLSAIAMKAELVQRGADARSIDGKRLRDIERMARETTQKVREMIWVVRDEHDSISGLVDQISASASTLLAGAIDYDLTISDALPDRTVDMELRRDVYSLYKEALQNAMKHSGADHVRIEVGWESGDFLLRVSDDGRGFDPGAVSHGNGLEFMSRRAAKHGGTVDVRSAQGEGTTVDLRVPLGRQAARGSARRLRRRSNGG